MHTLLHSLSVHLVTAQSRRLGLEWGDTDYHDSVSRLYLIEKGSAGIRHHRRNYTLKPDVVYLIPARTTFSYGCSGNFVQHWLHFNAVLNSGLEIFDCVPCIYAVPADKPGRMLSMFKRLERIGDTKEFSSVIEAKGLLLQLIAPFLETGGMAQSPSPVLRSLSGILEYIDAHLDGAIPVSMLARQMHLERAYFSRIFAQHTGLAPARYIRRRRAEVAREMLLSGDESLSAIAARLGFVDAFHFSKVFKRAMGMPPSQFRRSKQRP
jgi:AraC-like DNA-binding protein